MLKFFFSGYQVKCQDQDSGIVNIGIGTFQSSNFKEKRCKEFKLY
jgi:hypothetical protein